MTLSSFKLTANNHFVAMEYYMLLLNRTYLVLLTNDLIIGLQANGIVSSEGGDDYLTQSIVDPFTIKGDLNNPYSYLKQKYLQKIESVNLLDGSILHQPGANFIIKKTDLADVYFDERKKWGMGHYPHDGKVYVKTNIAKREFIILGNQSGQRIANLILFK
jgi:hypothetical protein